MTKIFTTTAILAAMTAASSVSAQDTAGDWYASVFAGASLLSDFEFEYTYSDFDIEVSQEFDPGYIVGVTVGTSFAPSIRAEVELSYAKYETGDITFSGSGYSGTYTYTYSGEGELEATYLLGNVWYDLAPIGGGATPYIGAGLGGVRVDAGGGVDDSTFAYQVGAGVKLPVGTATLDVGYRFKGTGELEFEVGDETRDFDPATSNSLQAAYVVTF